MPADHKSLQYKIWVLVMSKPFDTFILVLIALNTGVLMSQVSFCKASLVCHKVCHLLPVGLITKLVGHCTGMAVVIGSNPV